MVDLLSSEEAVIKKAKSLLEKDKAIPEKARAHFEELLKAYIKLNKGQSRLIRLSDKSQDKLNIAHSKLEIFSTKLSKYFSPQVYQSLFTGELDVKIETKRKQLTVFFSDLCLLLVFVGLVSISFFISTNSLILIVLPLSLLSVISVILG